MALRRIPKATWALIVTMAIWMVVYSRLYDITYAPGTSRDVSPVDMDKTRPQDVAFPAHYNRRPLYFNCQNIKDIRMVRRLGGGMSKSGFLGSYGDQKVVVRMTSNKDNVDSSRCLIEQHPDKKHFNKTWECLRLGAVKLMKEIMILEQLDHPGIIKLLGYCIRSEEVSSMNLGEHGAIVVSEFGQVLKRKIVYSWTLQERLERTLELMDILIYLEHSPLGSIEYLDFKLEHFVLLDNRIKAIDFDDATSLEPLCPEQNEAFSTKCIYDLPCKQGRCHGYNAKVNMWRFNRTFSRLLFPKSQIDKLPALLTIVNRLKQSDITAWEVKTMVQEVLRQSHVV